MGTRSHLREEVFPDGSEADAFYEACEQGWRDTFDGIRRFLEKSTSAGP